jgi:hypothetical protein
MLHKLIKGLQSSVADWDPFLFCQNFAKKSLGSDINFFYSILFHQYAYLPGGGLE